MDSSRLPWSKKQPKAYFAGMATGDLTKSEDIWNTNDYLGRLKLMQISIENPDLLHTYFSGTYHRWVEQVLPENKVPYLKNDT